MAESGYKRNWERAKFEDDQVLGAPLAWELDTMAQLLADNIKKLPPPARAAALIAAEALIAGMGATLTGVVSAMPAPDPEYRPAPLRAEVSALISKLRAIPDSGNPEQLAEFEEFIDRVEHLRGSLDGPEPSIPNFQTDGLIDAQISMMLAALAKKVAE